MGSKGSKLKWNILGTKILSNYIKQHSFVHENARLILFSKALIGLKAKKTKGNA
jgi:hypothetical protein